MPNENFRNELGHAFEEMSGSPSAALPDRVRSSLATAPEQRGPFWIAGIAAALIAVLLVGILVVANNGRPTSTARSRCRAVDPSGYRVRHAARSRIRTACLWRSRGTTRDATLLRGRACAAHARPAAAPSSQGKILHPEPARAACAPPRASRPASHDRWRPAPAIRQQL